MRRAGLVVARTLAAVAAEVRTGVSTADLDRVAQDVIRAAGAQPSFLGYGKDEDTPGFPGVICVSVNDEVLHGIPGSRVLADGDVVSVDCGAIVDGWHGDSAVTVFVGEPDPALHALSEATRTALWAGIGAARLGGHVRDVTAAVQAHVERAGPYGIVEDYVGHGIGREMHQEPDVPNRLAGGPLGRWLGRGPRITEGLALAVEPMLTLGAPETHVRDDAWTVATDDGSSACHWEHTMTVTRGGIWVLTAADGGEAELTARGLPFGPLAD